MAEKMELVIRNGMLVYPEKIVFGDVGIKGGRIAGFGKAGKLKGARIIDAEGSYVFPGFIDPHTHPVYLDNLGDTAYSAAWGGITTVAHYAYAKPGQSQLKVIREWKKEGGETSCIDFALHGGFFETLKQSDELPDCFKEGVTSYKMFLAYAKLGWMTDDYALVKAMEMIGMLGGMASVHAENGLAIDYIQDRLLAEKANFASRFLETSPDLAEAEAVFRAVTLGRLVRCAVYIPHVSSAETVEVLRFLRAKGVRAFFETCPHYLALTWDKLKKNGPMGKIGPAVKTQKDQDALWDAIRGGIFDTFGSDHAPKDKKSTDNFFKAPYGAPGVETMLSVIWEEGVNRGRIGPCDVARMLAENTARLLGIFPRKGRLAARSDADIVIFDPREKWTISAANQHSHCPYTLYEGKEILGRVQTVISRGKPVIEGNEFTGSRKHGKFIKTAAAREYLHT
jgi:dihydropyrimidinase